MHGVIYFTFGHKNLSLEEVGQLKLNPEGVVGNIIQGKALSFHAFWVGFQASVWNSRPSSHQSSPIFKSHMYEAFFWLMIVFHFAEMKFHKQWARWNDGRWRGSFRICYQSRCGIFLLCPVDWLADGAGAEAKWPWHTQQLLPSQQGVTLKSCDLATSVSN